MRQEIVGSLVCLGCKGTVIYGPTSEEIKVSMFVGAIVSVVAYLQLAKWFAGSPTLTGILIGAFVGMAGGAFAIGRFQAGNIRTRHRAVGDR